MNNPTKADVGNIAAVVILMNMAFFGNNDFVLLGLSFFLVIMAVYYMRKDKETIKLSPARISLAVLMVAVNVALGIYILVVTRPAPLSP